MNSDPDPDPDPGPGSQTQIPAHRPQQQRVPGRSSPTPAYLGTWAPPSLHSSPKLSQWSARWKRMIDRQLPGEAAMSNQSRPRALLPNPPASPSSSPITATLNHSVAFSPVFAGPQTMIVHDPRVLLVNNPRWRSVMRRQLPRPGPRETRGEKDEPRLAADALDRQARQSAESYIHACPYSRTRTLPGAPSAESQALSVFPPHPHLTSPHYAY